MQMNFIFFLFCILRSEPGALHILAKSSPPVLYLQSLALFWDNVVQFRLVCCYAAPSPVCLPYNTPLTASPELWLRVLQPHLAVLFVLFYVVLYFMDLETEPRAFHVIGKSSTTELYLQAWDKVTIAEEIRPEMRTHAWNSSGEKAFKLNWLGYSVSGS